MIIHNLVQSSPEWHSFRAVHFGASEAAAMLGLSKYKTRSELLREKVTGITQVHSEATQEVFDHGHVTEAACRPIIEAQIESDLYPVTLSDGDLSCSCDGLTADDSVAWEHKQFSKPLFASVTAGVLPDEHQPQCQQVLMITGAEKLIFTCSDGTIESSVSMEVFPDPSWQKRIRDGWAQFKLDMESYTEGEYIPAPAKATPTKDLPTVSLQVTGGLRVITNLDLFHEALKHFIGNINMEPDDDQGFADCKDAVKKLKAAEDALDAGEAQALAQITSIDEMRRMKKLVAETARTTRLAVEKIVKERDVLVKRQIVDDAKDAINEHIASLNKQIGKPYMPGIESKFADVMKSKKTFASMREAVNNELVRVKIEASAIGNMIGINMNTMRELAKDHTFLFSDTGSLVLKDNEALEAIIKNRIADHKQAEAAKEEATRQRIQQEEEEKARIAYVNELQRTDKLDKVVEAEQAPIKLTGAKVSIPLKVAATPRPTSKMITELIAGHYGVSYGTACDWVIEAAQTMQEAA